MNLTITIAVGMMTGFLSALCASAVFVIFMYSQRPRLKLSKRIAKTSFEGKTIYAFKVINTGRRDAHSVNAELFLIQPHKVEGGIGYNIMEIALARKKLFQIRPLAKVGDKFGGVFEFITTEDLEEEWRNFKGSYLLFQVHAQDSLSLFSQVFNAEFDTPDNSIVPGRFAKGPSMRITPNAPPPGTRQGGDSDHVRRLPTPLHAHQHPHPLPSEEGRNEVRRYLGDNYPPPGPLSEDATDSEL